ncbi:MAG: hypothetical protein IIC73_02780 [Armatimonadetes bacterium]|nr:hypothetical protein [Armatimonadota bacterium]
MRCSPNARQTRETVDWESPLAAAIAKRLRQAHTDSAHRLRQDDEMSAEIIEWFEGGLTPDPTHLMAGDAVLQIAEAAGYSVVALLFDGFFSGGLVDKYDGRPLSEVLAVYSRMIEIDTESKQIKIRSAPTPFNAPRFDRAAATKLALQVYEEGWSRIEPLAIYAMTCESDLPWQYGRRLSSVLQPERYGPMQMMAEAVRRTFSIYGSLPKAARAMAHDDWLSYPVRDLPKNVRELVYAAYAEKTFSPDHGQSTDYRWMRWPMVAMTHHPDGRAADLEGAFLDVRVEQAQLLIARDHKEGNRISSAGLLSPKEAAARIHSAMQGEQTSKIDFTILGEITAERLILRIRTRSNGNFLVVLTTDSSNPETRYLPYEQISSNLGKQLKQELARLGSRQMVATKEEQNK